MSERETGHASEDNGMLEAYEYPESADAPFVPTWSGWETAPDADRVQEEPEITKADSESAHAEFSRRLAEETARAFEAGHKRGMDEGREAECAAHASTLAAMREKQVRQTAELVERFGSQRELYLKAVEQEVVGLALAVAARVLRREAQTDPLLLMGAVRAALGQVATCTEVRLRVPPADSDLWIEAIALLPNTGAKPQVIPENGMQLGECIIETSLGKADLGIRSQLAEIERCILGKQENKDTRSKTNAGAESHEVSH